MLTSHFILLKLLCLKLHYSTIPMSARLPIGETWLFKYNTINPHKNIIDYYCDYSKFNLRHDNTTPGNQNMSKIDRIRLKRYLITSFPLEQQFIPL